MDRQYVPHIWAGIVPRGDLGAERLELATERAQIRS
jgi:hypothetical protein